MRAVNLIPADQRRSVSAAGRSQGAAYAVLVVIGGLAILALLYGRADRQITHRRAEAASLSARAQRAQAAASALAPYTSFIALREQRTQAVLQLADSRFDWAHALHELGRVMPHGASIVSIDGEIGSPTATAATSSSSSSGASAGASSGASSTVTSATPPGTVPTITINGCATSQANVALTLERLHLIDGVGEVKLQSSTKPTAGASAGGVGAGCPGRDPAFVAQVSFDPLPNIPLSGSPAAKLTSSGSASHAGAAGQATGASR